MRETYGEIGRWEDSEGVLILSGYEEGDSGVEWFPELCHLKFSFAFLLSFLDFLLAVFFLLDLCLDIANSAEGALT